ncbi:YdbL family protein [Novosphingobium album (ex Liu et al. 2023)]|uniref:YdbL family protein n=1 Tax=Novosphingobium album (ex Liu et al. 2023) TaxID=3031130 RepID=A0ABT5WNF2_9SPHN|nr:YdbL family protein [Novosphingobium album (ex Liu et al. 2023)]MDE8651564.1 YdbL family protein [Novosphingobium album (ex Liu et al. 2023)]
MRNDMQTSRFHRIGLAAGAAALMLAGLAAPAFAQRDPAYEAARAAGQIGEKMDGYLGAVGGVPAAVQKMISDLNIKRKAVYAQKAQEQHATLEEYAFTSGCLLISQTRPGEKYQAPDGSWQTRGGGAPQRDPRCP